MLRQTLQEAGLHTLNVGLTKSHITELKAILAREPELHKQLSEFLTMREKPDIDVIAVTHGPGLEPALWVGINFAKALSLAWDIPIVAVNHMEGHIVLPMMEMTKSEHSHILQNMRMFGRLKQIDFPVLALLISGGHTELVLSKQFGTYQIIGQTRDDAVGEAFDKVARLLGLGSSYQSSRRGGTLPRRRLGTLKGIASRIQTSPPDAPCLLCPCFAKATKGMAKLRRAKGE